MKSNSIEESLIIANRFLDDIDALVVKYGGGHLQSRSEINSFYDTRNYAHFVNLDINSCYLSIDCDGTWRNLITPHGHYQAMCAFGVHHFLSDIFKSMEKKYKLILSATDSSFVKYYLIYFA